MQTLQLFAFGFILDVLYVLYQNFSVRDKRLFAVPLGMLLTIIGALSWVEISENKGMLIPYVLGVGLGIYVGMWLTARYFRNGDSIK